MTLQGDIVAETGLDLADPKLSETLAPALADRLTSTFPAFGDARKAVSAIMGAYKGMGASPTVLGAMNIAVSVVGTAASLFEGRLDNDISGNVQRLEDARNLTIRAWVHPGDWSTALYANGPAVGSCDLANNVGGWDESMFLAQYNAGLVWMCHRSGKSDILQPTWPSPPFTNGYGFMTGEQEVVFPKWSPLTGFSVKSRIFRPTQPPVAPFSSDYDEDYFGTLPAPTLADLSEAGLEGAPKLLKSLIVKMESAWLNDAFVPPPDFTYLFSVGTYPYTSWSTASNGQPGPGAAVVLNTSMAALAAAIHSVTPIHALVRSSEVARCYRAWLRTTRIRQLPPLPKGQVDSGIYLDDAGLPWSPNPLATLMCVQPANLPEPKYDWEKEAAAVCKADPSLATQVNSGCYPEGLGMSGYAISVSVIREIEIAFRSFFSVRRAAVYQMDLATSEFRTAAANSQDPVIAAAARGKTPRYTPWDPSDPLGDGWRKKGYGGTDTVEGPKPGAVKKKPVLENPADRIVAPTAKQSSSDLWRYVITGVAGLAGAAALGYSERARLQAWLRRRRGPR